MYWQEWELFVAFHVAFHTNLMIKCGKQTAYLKDLYCGAHGTQATLDLEVNLKDLSVYLAQEQFPCSILTDKFNSETINWENGENLIVNGSSAKWGDVFVVRTITLNQPTVITPGLEKQLHIFQCKYDYLSEEFTSEDLANEEIKNLENSIATQGDLRHKLAEHCHITILFTTQPFTPGISRDSSLVIAMDNFEKYFSPVFTSRAVFFSTKDVNPNFSELKRMEKYIPGVSEVTSKEVVENQPYISKDDFYEKHSQAKRGMEDYKQKHPGKKRKLSFYPFDAL
ncbi:7414_t:CDS:1 [Paraglomus occultum]|uniref:7414_t:CDS:1 n=1 Tax=Paraglomus occultum TaxID=144539 RepID=A0A9N9D9Q5_9GLOM|nr:7414_t:CDS:1 [Paraglomus occultum]